MTVCEQYAKDKGFKPLTKKELKKGKAINVYNTKEPMPWKTIYTMIEGGMPLDAIHEAYGKIRKITLFAIIDGVDVNEKYVNTIDNAIIGERGMSEIEADDPDVADTLRTVMVAFAPDLNKKVIKFAAAVMDRSIRIINDKDCTSNDVKNLTASVQTTTDIVGLTERHNKVGGNAITNVQVEGFTFSLDKPPEPTDVIDIVEVKTDDE
jgi:hypothetical protein